MKSGFSDDVEIPQTLRERYAYPVAWRVRSNKAEEPARPPEPVRSVTPARTGIQVRPPLPPRPK